MRFNILVFVMFLATLSHAQTGGTEAAASQTETISRSQDRNMVDIGYLLPQGKVGLRLYANVKMETFEIEQNAIPDSKANTFGNRLGVEVSYGILDNLNIAAGISYVPTKRTSEELNNLTSESRGWEEPTVDLQYRFLTQADSMPFDVTLDLSYSPKTEDSKWPTPDSKGTVARGGDKTSFGLGFYRHTSTGELALVLNHVSFGSTEGKSASSSTAVTTKPTQTTSAMGIGQFPYNDKLFVRAGVGGTHYQETETTSAIVTTVEAYNTLDVLGGMRIVIVPDTSMVDLSISVQSLVRTDIEIDEGGTKKEMTSASRVNFFAGLKFLY